MLVKESPVRQTRRRDHDVGVVSLDVVVNRCATVGAEIENGFAAFIPDTHILCRFACDGDGVAAKACLCAEDAASPPLAREAMAD